MRRRAVVATAALAAVALSLAPAQAATKKKPKPIKGSYTLNLMPDPSTEVRNEVPGQEGCDGVSPQGKDDHVLTVPAKGTLHVVLDSPDPTGSVALPGGSVGTDWDLYLLDTDGSVYDSSHGSTSHEETVSKFKKGQKITVEVCNLIGEPNATVSWVFTYA